MKINQKQPTAFLFAGQGNPVIGMGSDLWDINETTRKIWDCASDISQTDIRRLCLKGPMTKLVQTTNQQIAVTAINATLYELCLEKQNFENVVGFCGHSVGEYAALYAAKAISLENLFKMIQFRAQLMHDLSKVNKGLMYAVKGIDYSTLVRLIEQSGIAVDVSCDNSHQQQVIGGTSSALSEFSRVLLSEGYESTKLGVSGAWHTHLMQDGVQKMRDFLATVDIKCPEHNVFMNVTGQPEIDPKIIKENLSLHLTHAVKWTDSMEYLIQHSEKPTLLEVSNKAYLGHMLNDFDGFTSDRTIHCRNVIGAI